MKYALVLLLGSAVGLKCAAQGKEELGDKEYIIVKDYKPVLAESFKISDSPEGDTASFTPPKMKYNVPSQKAETNYETATIKAVKIKDEPLEKLYRSLLKLGIGNYNTYNGELYVNSLRSKQGELGLSLKHLSGSPRLSGVGDPSFSNSKAAVYGKYFLEHATFDGGVSFDRDVNHYYGFNTDDTIIAKKDIRQRINCMGIRLGIASRYLTEEHLDYDAHVAFSSLNDSYDVTESDVLLNGKVGKRMKDKYLALDASFDFFKKTDASYEVLTSYHNLSRNLINLTPSVTFTQKKAKLIVGATLSMEQNVNSAVHLFPKADIILPVAEHVLSLYAGVDGSTQKNSFRTVTADNPFVTSAIKPLNTVDQLRLKAGANGNFSSTVSFNASVNYSTLKDLMMYVQDTAQKFKFNLAYDDAKLLNVHFELGYKAGEKLDVSLHFDQYSYTMTREMKPWHRPANEVSLRGRYNMQDKIIVDLSVFARGKYYNREQVAGGFTAQKVNGYVDGNIGIEYRYTRILSFFLKANNVGFNKYQLWYGYPTERFNVLGGLTYSF